MNLTPFATLRVHPEGFTLKGKPLTPSPNSDIELNWKIILFGEGESFERRLRPLSRRTPLVENANILW